ncbi:hypothetical protein RA276_28085, partial [Pseudomonas syringae pv. tagetis]|uniref:hypothetical protein n=1 Tax=Pseudomonas syringae group genomosp. 7 TaxID=251699 RepID=UPI00376F5A89
MDDCEWDGCFGGWLGGLCVCGVGWVWCCVCVLFLFCWLGFGGCCGGGLGGVWFLVCLVVFLCGCFFWGVVWGGFLLGCGVFFLFGGWMVWLQCSLVCRCSREVLWGWVWLWFR